MELYNYNELGMVSRQKVMSAAKRNIDYLAYAIEKTREYCERQLYKHGMPRNGTNAYVTWRNMTTLADGRVSHDISIDFRESPFLFFYVLVCCIIVVEICFLGFEWRMFYGKSCFVFGTLTRYSTSCS